LILYSPISHFPSLSQFKIMTLPLSTHNSHFPDISLSERFGYNPCITDIINITLIVFFHSLFRAKQPYKGIEECVLHYFQDQEIKVTSLPDLIMLITDRLIGNSWLFLCVNPAGKW